MSSAVSTARPQAVAIPVADTLPWLIGAAVVGLIQGVTELFPISSLGHNVLLPALVGGSWEADLNVAAEIRYGRVPEVERRIDEATAHLDELQSKARAINTTLLDTKRVGQGCVLASPAF